MKKTTIKKIKSDFKKDYPLLFEVKTVRLEICWRLSDDIDEEKRATLPEYTTEDTEITPDLYELHLWSPLIFDHRMIPKSYKGYNLEIVIIFDKSPLEWNFGDRENIDYKESEDPQKYIEFVKRCTDEIRETLKSPKMSFEDMLDAICWGDYEMFKAKYERTLKEFEEQEAKL